MARRQRARLIVEELSRQVATDRACAAVLLAYEAEIDDPGNRRAPPGWRCRPSTMRERSSVRSRTKSRRPSTRGAYNDRYREEETHSRGAPPRDPPGRGRRRSRRDRSDERRRARRSHPRRGGDPEAIGRRGAALAEELLARRKRLDWQAKARGDMEAALAKMATAPKTPKLREPSSSPGLRPPAATPASARRSPRRFASAPPRSAPTTSSAPARRDWTLRKLEES